MNSCYTFQLTDNSYDFNLELLYKKLSSDFIKSFTSYDNDRKKLIDTLIKK